VPSVVQLIGPPTNPPTNLVSGPTNLTPVNSTLYFEANDGTQGTEIWRTAGRPGDAARVQGGPVYFDPGTAVPEQVQVGRWLYYFTDNGNFTYTLWRNDSKASPTDGISPSEAILTIPGPTNDWGPYQLTAVGNNLYFGTYSFAHTEWELWKVAGADAPSGTTLTAAQLQASPGLDQIDSNGPGHIWAAGSNLYFEADDPSGTYSVLWGSDGTPGGTKPVQVAGGGYVSPSGISAAAVGNDLYTIEDHYDTNGNFLSGTLYQVYDSATNQWTATPIPSVGATIGAPTGPGDSTPSYFMTAASDGSVYFLTAGGQNGFQYDLWKCNGSTASEVWQSQAGIEAFPLQMAAVGSDVYFTDYAPGSAYFNRDLWKSDGTSQGTQLMKSFEIGYDYNGTTSIPFGLTPVGSTLYFEGPDGRIWQSGGTPETTNSTDGLRYEQPALDLYDLSIIPFNDYPGAASPLAAVGSTLYISPLAFRGGVGQLWRLNNPPVANADAYIADPGSTLTVSAAAGVLANDTDADPGDVPYLTASVVSGPANGTLAFNPDGSFTYTPNAGYVGPDSFTYQASDGFDPSNVATVSLTAAPATGQTFAQFLQGYVQSSPSTPAVTIEAGAGTTTPATVIPAVSGLTNVSQPITITLDLANSAYSLGSLVYNPADASNAQNVTFIIENGTLQGSLIIQGGNVQLKNVTLDPDSPALTVAGGQVLLTGCTLTTTGDAPTLLVTGGSVTLLNDGVTQASTVYSDPAIAVTGGTVNLGTAATPGNNTLSVNSSSSLVSNSSGNPISAVGSTFIAGGTVLPSLTLSFTAITSSATTTLYGQSVTFTATVQPDGSGTPSGTVDFVDTSTGTDLGSATLSGDLATVTTAALNAGSHVIVVRYGGDSTFLPSNASVIQPVSQATPVFGAMSTTVITDGTPRVALSGSLTSGSLVPTGSVTVTMDSVSQTVSMGADGSFSATFNTASLNVGVHTITLSYGGDPNFTSAAATASLDDTYKVVALFNQTKAKSPGSVLPIQIALDTSSNQDVSSSGATVTALGIAATTDTTDTVGSIDPSQLGTLTTVQAAGTANPGNVFRYQGGNNPFYMYNLQIPTGLTKGTYRLYFSVAGDPLDHWVTFTVD
jgi:ELWxxDGT repeat protein